MPSRLAAIATLFFGVVSLAPAQQKTLARPTDERQAQLNSLIQDFVKARREALAAMRGAQSETERRAAEGRMPKEADYLPRVHKLIAGGKNDEVAAEALAFAVFGLNTKDKTVYDSLAKHFVKTDKIRRFVRMAIRGAPDVAQPVLESVLASNPSKDLKGMACYALGAMAFEKEGPAAAKEAEKYFARVEHEFAEVNGGRETLGAMAKTSLYELRHLQVGMKAPVAECKTLNGDAASLAKLRGRVVVMDFWATWCGPCRQMIPHEREMAEKFKDKPFALVSISADEDKKELQDFLAKETMPWTHWWDGADAPIVKQWNIRFFPTIYVIDAKGVIRYKHIRGVELGERGRKTPGRGQ